MRMFGVIVTMIDDGQIAGVALYNTLEVLKTSSNRLFEK